MTSSKSVKVMQLCCMHNICATKLVTMLQQFCTYTFDLIYPFCLIYKNVYSTSTGHSGQAVQQYSHVYLSFLALMPIIHVTSVTLFATYCTLLYMRSQKHFAMLPHPLLVHYKPRTTVPKNPLCITHLLTKQHEY